MGLATNNGCERQQEKYTHIPFSAEQWVRKVIFAFRSEVLGQEDIFSRTRLEPIWLLAGTVVRRRRIYPQRRGSRRCRVQSALGSRVAWRSEFVDVDVLPPDTKAKRTFASRRSA